VSTTTYSPCQCRFARWAPLHHDMLLSVETDVAMAVELVELATTWEELDYSGQAVIPPSEWLDFAGAHSWRDTELAFRLFGVATDVAARRSQPAVAAWERH
jgi:hypothetical protein